MPPPVFRIAPSPNGYLHLGHAFSALLNFDLARQTGGRLLLRIEDIDATRCRPEFETAIYEDLAWLGIAWETPVRRSIPARQNCFCPVSARDCSNRTRLTRCGSTWRRPARAPAISFGPSMAKVPMARPARWPPGRKSGSTS